MTPHSSNLGGYRVLGRHGELGVVVNEQFLSTGSGIAVRGGVSSALLFHVPHARVRSIEPDRRVVQLDIDLADFVPSLLDDGTVELRVGRG